jgi:hypothetical protein
MEEKVNRWRSVSWKRVGIALLLVYISFWAVWGAFLLISHQLRPSITARELARDFPELNTIPRVAPDTSQAPLAGVRVEFFGLSFQTPWKDIVHKTSSHYISSANFNDGAAVMAFDPDLNPDKLVVRQLRANHVLDDQALPSDYGLWAAAMATTSDQVKWWRLPSQKRFALLMTKMALIHGDSSALYSFASGGFRGFQEGNPSVAPYRVELNLFDNLDRHYQIVFSDRDMHQPFLTQAEINSMIASLKSVPGN